MLIILVWDALYVIWNIEIFDRQITVSHVREKIDLEHLQDGDQIDRRISKPRSRDATERREKKGTTDNCRGWQAEEHLFAEARFARAARKRRE